MRHWSSNPKLILLTPFIIAMVFIVACGGSATSTPKPAATAAPAAPAATTAAAAAATAVPTAAPEATKAAPVVAAPAVNPGKVVMMTNDFDMERWDSAFGSMGADITRQFHGFLVGTEVVDGAMAVVPGLATDWELTNDGYSIVFTVREGSQFHDGSIIEPEDVLWSMQHHHGPTSPDYAVGSLAMRYGKVMEEIVLGPGPNDVTMTATKRIPEVPNYSAKGAGGNALGKIMPQRATLHNEAEELAYDKNPIGSGVLKFVSHTPGTKQVYERFADYYHRPDNGFSNDLRINFATMEFILAVDESTRIAAIRAGEADMGRVSLGAESQIEAGGGKLVFSPEARSFETIFTGCYRSAEREGLPDMPCADKRVRQALAYSINKTQMQEELFGPAVMQAKGWWVVTPSTIGYELDLDPYPFDPAKARELLTAAGYKNPDNPGGKDFGDLVINTYISAFIPFMVESAQLAAEMWETELGIATEVRQLDRVDMQQRTLFAPRDYDGQILWKGQDSRTDAAGIANLFFNGRDSSASYYYHSNEELWDLGDDTLNYIGLPNEQEKFHAWYKRLHEEAYFMGVGYINIPWGVGPAIESWQPGPVAEYASDFHTIVLK